MSKKTKKKLPLSLPQIRSEHKEPLIAEFYLRLEDGRFSSGRTDMTFCWSFDDWLLLQKCGALDIEEFCWSMLFETFIHRYGTLEQKRIFRMLRQEITLEL